MFNECCTSITANFRLLKYRYRGGWVYTTRILIVVIVMLTLSAAFLGFRHTNIFDRVDKLLVSRIRQDHSATKDIRIYQLTSSNLLLPAQKKKPTFLLFSAMTLNYMETYRDYIQRNEYYAKVQNYSYELIIAVGTFGHHPTGMKLHAANELLHNQSDSSTLVIARGNSRLQFATEDWLVFLDADAFVAELDIPLTTLIEAADRYMDTHTGVSKAPCHFIGQDQSNIVNSGFFLIRNSDWSRQFVTSWIAEFVKAETQWGIDLWVYDQGALMNTILHYAADLVGDLYEDYCVGAAAHANKCYRQTLEKLGFPYGKRKFGHICLLPDIGIPYSFHIHNEYRRGELIRHQKGLRIPSNQSPVLPYSHIWTPSSLTVDDTGHMHLNNGTIISIAFKNSSTPFQHVLFMITDDKKKHLIPDWDTFLSLDTGLTSEETIPVSEEFFETISWGADLPSIVHSTTRSLKGTYNKHK